MIATAIHYDPAYVSYFKMRKLLSGTIEITFRLLRTYALQGATHSFAFARCLIRLFSSIGHFISSHILSRVSSIN